MVRQVTSLAKFFRYDERSTKTADGLTVLTANVGRWEEVGNNSTYIASQTGPSGADRDIRLISASDVLVPEYPADGSLSLPVKLIWFHDEGTSSPLPQGTRFTLSVLAAGANKTELFRNKIKLTFRGFVDLSDGTLDTSDGLSGTMLGVDEEIDFEPGKSSLLLQKDLPQGSGYLVEARLKFSLWELNGQIGINTPLQMFLFPFAQAGNYSESGSFVGNIVYPTDDRLRVVPGPNLQARVLSGGAMVASYSFLKNPVRLVTDLLANTGGQQVTINGDGAAFLRSGTIPASEALRAVVSTQSGQGVTSAASAGVATTGSTSKLTVTVGYPSDVDGVGTIRSNYPDSQIAAVSAADVTFNPPTIYLFVNNGSQIRRFSFNVVPDVNQTFEITDWSAGTVVGSIPGASDPYQGLFVPNTPAVAGAGSGGNLAAATYTVTAAFYHDGNQVSRVNHGAVGAIGYWAEDIPTLLRSAVPYASLDEPSGFTQPSVGGSVTVDVTNGRVLAVGGGVTINDLSGVFHGTYTITAKPTANSVTLQLENATGGTAPAGTVPASSLLLASGSPGSPGADGIDGIDGRTLLNGSGVPGGGTGSNGDFYIDTVADAIYGPKTAGVWGSPTNLIGPTGPTGRTGGIALTFDTGTSAGGLSGELRFNNAAIASTTNLFVSETDADGASIEAVLGSLTVGTQLMVTTANSTGNRVYFAVSGAIVDNGSNRTVPVTYQSHVGSFSDGTPIVLIVALRGSTGATGATGSVSAATSINFTEQGSDPSTPGSGTLVLFAGSDRILYTINSSGTKQQVGSGTGAGRQVLTANRTYYVRPGGNNSNTGLTNTDGGAFATIQKAIDTLTTLDGGGLYEGIVKIATGTYTTPVQLKQVVGFTRIVIEGDPATPSNVVVSTTNNDAFGGNSSVASTYQLRGLKIQTTGTGHAVNATFLPNIFIEIDRCDFGATAYSHMIAGAEAVIQTISNYSISGGGNSHAESYDAGYIRLGSGTAESSYTVTVTGTPAFAFAFAYAARGGHILAVNQTYVGSATGQRFNVSPPSIITVVGGSGTFPGNVAGSGSGSGGRQVLTANRTYYVRSDGNDSNTGLTNNSVGAFATWQGAIDAVSRIDDAGYTVTIQAGVAAQTWNQAASLIIKKPIGGGNLTLNFNGGTLQSSGNLADNGVDYRALVEAKNIQNVTIKNVTLMHTNLSTNGNWNVALRAQNYADIVLNAVNFSELANSNVFSAHMQSEVHSSIYILSNYTINGGAGVSNNSAVHWRPRTGGIISINDSRVVTLSSAPKFAIFADVQTTAVWQGYDITFNGSLSTGCQKHLITGNGVVTTFGGGSETTFFPGSISGVRQSGGQFL
jgi:hypothetical protein